MNLNAVKNYLPKPLRAALKQYFRLGTYPHWKSIVKNDKTVWKSALASAKSGKKVLIGTCIGAHRVGNIIESTLAAALTLRGVEAHALLCDSMLPACSEAQYAKTKNMSDFVTGGTRKTGYCTGCFSYAAQMYKDLGITLHRFSELVTPEEKHEAEKIAATVPFKDIPTYKYKDIVVGEDAMASAIRFYCTGDLEGQESAEPVLRRYFYGALLTMFAVERLFKKYTFESMVSFHGVYVPNGVLGEVARKRNVRVVNWGTAYRKKRFEFSHHDTYHRMMLVEPVSNWKDMPWNDDLENKTMAYLKSREVGTRDWQQFHENVDLSLEYAVRELNIDFAKPTIGLLPNVVWDAQIVYPSNAFKNLIEWTIKTIEYFRKRPDLQLVIRVHPAEIKCHTTTRQPLLAEIQKHFPTIPKNVFVIPADSRISTYTVMQQCNAILIYGTKTGVEMAARGIPIIIAGEAWIRNKGLTMDASSPEEYFSILDKLPLKKGMDTEQLRLARKYAYHFFYRRGVYLPFLDISKDSISFRLGIKRISELSQGKSIGLDVLCDGI